MITLYYREDCPFCWKVRLTMLARFGLADHYGVAVDSRHPTLLRWYERMRYRRSFIATEPERPWPAKQQVAI